ncbi:TPA: hypothetical protein ACIVAT_000624 [Salmonella enterica subsp. enterica serovar Waycross]
MTAWKYLKGSENDFEGAPEWVTRRIKGEWTSKHSFVGVVGRRLHVCDIGDENRDGVAFNEGYRYEIIAQREPVTTADVEVVKYDPTKVDDFASDATINKYTRECKGVQVDVYDVLQAFDVTNPALQHLIKKALCVGIRGHKTKQQDLQEIIDSAIRAKELEQ